MAEKAEKPVKKVTDYQYRELTHEEAYPPYPERSAEEAKAEE